MQDPPLVFRELVSVNYWLVIDEVFCTTVMLVHLWIYDVLNIFAARDSDINGGK